MTTAICFDLDGTLLQYDRSYEAITTAALEAHLGSATDEAVAAYDEAFFAAFEALDPDPYHAGMRGVLDYAESSGAFDDEALAAADVDAMVATQGEQERDATQVPAAARDCLGALADDADTRLAVVTDGVGDRQRAKLDHHDLTGFLDATVVSYEVGGHKVSGAPYDAVRQRLAAEEYVMVGDSYESDVEAARAAGFVPIHYENDGPDLFSILDALL